MSRSIPRTMLSTTLVLTLAMTLVQGLHAQTFTVLHAFTGGGDGAAPMAGLTMNAAGTFYGTTQFGGDLSHCPGNGCGSVFKLTHRGSSWVLNPLYAFKGGEDSAWPSARVVLGPGGVLYGTTAANTGGTGCSENGCGTVFSLHPPATVCVSVSCPWVKTVLYRFAGMPDGQIPSHGDLVFDSAGNIYGTTTYGGTYGWGPVYKLTHSSGGWTESILYSFTGQQDGGYPVGGVTFDSAGNLYGTTFEGGFVSPPDNNGYGVIFELTPSGSGWTESVVNKFFDGNDGGLPAASLTMDQAGNFYGTTYAGGTGTCISGYYTGCGSVFLNDGQPIYTFGNLQQFAPLSGPLASVSLDASGNLYGTTSGDGINSLGNVFRLTSRQYAYTSLHDFTGRSDGGAPVSSVVVDATGNLYGTASIGGTGSGCPGGCGVIWEITP